MNRINFLIHGRALRGLSFRDLVAWLEQEAPKHLPNGPHIVLGEIVQRRPRGVPHNFLAVHVLEEPRFTASMTALFRELAWWIDKRRDVTLTWRHTCTAHTDCRRHPDLGRACYNSEARSSVA